MLRNACVHVYIYIECMLVCVGILFIYCLHFCIYFYLIEVVLN